MRKINYFTLFAGCGGSSTGYEAAGFTPLLAVDWSKVTKNAMETYKLNHPKTKVEDTNIRELTSERCMKLAGIKKGELDLLDGSPPCKGFSLSNTRNRSIENEQNELVNDMIRLVREIQPKVFIMENVAGLIKYPMQLKAIQIIEEFENCGYSVKAKILNARNYGVPQSRPRIFIIGIRNDLGITPTFPTEHQPLIPFGKLLRWDGRLLTEKEKARIQKSRFFKGRFADLNAPCPTLTAMYGIGAESPWIKFGNEIYELSVEELKILCSFPAEYQFVGTRKERITQIGNCVPPLLVKAVAEHILKLVFHVPPANSSSLRIVVPDEIAPPFEGDSFDIAA